MGQIVLKIHAGPKDVAYGSLLAQYIVDQTRHNGPESQYLALREQLVQLSNVYNDSKNAWFVVEKNVGGYISQLQIDKKGKNPQGRKCFNCGSPDHYKNQCPQKKATGGSRNGKKSCGKGGNKKKWQNINKDEKSEMKKDGTI